MLIVLYMLTEMLTKNAHKYAHVPLFCWNYLALVLYMLTEMLTINAHKNAHCHVLICSLS
jgi:hypothetical protein